MTLTDSPAAGEACGACGGLFPTLVDVFAHPCPATAARRRIGSVIVETADNGFGAPTTRSVDRATEAQVRYLTNLARLAGVEVDTATLTKAEASAKIDRLRADVDGRPAPAPAAGDHRPNRYPGTCRTCRAEVAVGAGRIEKLDGKWATYHLPGGCPERPAPAPAAAPAAPLPDVPAGRYAVDNAEGVLRFYVVDRPDEGRWAGRTFVSVLASDERHPVKGDAARAVLAKIAEDPRAASIRFGRELGVCGVCGRTLTDEASRAAGIGPVCAGKF